MLKAKILLPYGMTAKQYENLKKILPDVKTSQDEYYIYTDRFGRVVPAPLIRSIECYVDEAQVNGDAKILRERPPKEGYVTLMWWSRNVIVNLEELYKTVPDITFDVINFIREDEEE